MTSLISSYIILLTSLVEYFHADSKVVDPAAINKAKFYARALSIAFWYINRPGLPIRKVGAALKQRFGEHNLLSDLIEDAPIKLLSLFDSVEMPVRHDHLGDIYEQLLSIETSGFEVKSGKEYRNKLGSYYTPPEYAKEITRLTFENFFQDNSIDKLKNVKIVDFSCGCGAFIVAALEQCKKNGLYKENLQDVIQNLYACDVDPLALEIAKISVLDICNAPSYYDVLSNNFRHANFLIHTNKEVSQIVRLQASMNGYIYHEDLALGTDFLQQYDIILGNPPWEKIRFEEKKFFSQFLGGISLINFKFNLGLSIDRILEDNPMIRDYTTNYKMQLEASKKQIKQNPFFKDSVSGELNTCSLFADSAYQLLSSIGVSGLLVKSSLFTAKVNKILFNKLNNRTVAIYDFINRNKIFDIDSRERFGILLLGKNRTGMIRLGMNLLSISDIQNKAEDVQLSILKVLNPETKMIPNLNSGMDLIILSSLYSSFDIFSKIFPNAKFGRLVHLTNHVKYIDKEPKEDNLPIVEGKFFSIFDNSYSGFNDVPEIDRYKSKAASKKLTVEQKAAGIRPQSRFYIKNEKWVELSRQYNSDYMLAWHSLTSATNLRSCVATIMPFSPGSQSVQFLTLPNNDDLIYLAGIFNSVVFDYIVKCKLNGIDLTQAIITQLPVPSIESAKSIIVELNGRDESLYGLIIQIVRSFYSNDVTLSGMINAPEQSIFDNVPREELFIFLDSFVAKLYKLEQSHLDYILNSFSRFYSENARRKVIHNFLKLG